MRHNSRPSRCLPARLPVSAPHVERSSERWHELHRGDVSPVRWDATPTISAPPRIVPAGRYCACNLRYFCNQRDSSCRAGTIVPRSKERTAQDASAAGVFLLGTSCEHARANSVQRSLSTTSRQDALNSNELVAVREREVPGSPARPPAAEKPGMCLMDRK